MYMYALFTSHLRTMIGYYNNVMHQKMRHNTRLDPFCLLSIHPHVNPPTPTYSLPHCSLVSCALTEVTTLVWRGSSNSCTSHAWQRMALMTWRKVPSCWKCMPWRYRCTQSRKTTRSWRLSMSSPCTSSPPYPIHWSWGSLEVREGVIRDIWEGH